MILRWAAATYLETEKHFRRIMGYKSLWVLEAALREGKEEEKEENQTREVAATEGDQPKPTHFLQAAAT